MTLFRHVLAPLDLSMRSRHTAVHAAALARTCNATLTLLHVLPGRANDEQRAHALAALNDIAHDICGRALARVAVAEGDTSDEVRRYALDYGADLVVVGARHRSLLDRLFFHRVSKQITTAGDWSVYAVPDADEEAQRPPANHWEVLCAIDLSQTSPAAVHTAAAMARAHHAHLTVLHTIDIEPVLSPHAFMYAEHVGFNREVARSARERLARLLAAETGPTLAVDSLVAFGPADQEILRITKAVRPEFVVIGAHSGRLLGDSTLGPTAASLLRQAPCPLLLVRSQAVPAASEADELQEALAGQD